MDMDLLTNENDLFKDTTTASTKKPLITSKGWILEDMLKQGPNFEVVPRISALASLEEINKRIGDYEDRGIPLIIEGWHEHPKWPKDLFSVDWLLEHGEQTVLARNCLNWTDKEMTLPDFIDKCRTSSPYVEEGDNERYYGKDAYCPKEWEEWIENGPLPPSLLPRGSNNLLQYLPKSHYVETLMCYFGIGDTYTPAHKDLCASSGHNLMCYTENSGSSFWFMTKSSDAPSAAKYFQENLGYELDHESYVATTKDFAGAPFTVYLAEQKLGDLVLVPKRSCHQVVNGGGMTIKSSWSRMTIDGLVTAFYHELPIYRRVCRVETYRVRALCYHSILHYSNEVEEIQKRLSDRPDTKDNNDITDITDAKIFTRQEQDDEKGLLSLDSSPLSELPEEIEENTMDVSEGITGPTPSESKNVEDIEARLESIAYYLKSLIPIFDKILKEEYDDNIVSSQLPGILLSASHTSTSLSTAIASNITCDFCGADIFQSFFECKDCVASDVTEDPKKESEEAVVICPGCYVEGRTCVCSEMRPRLSDSFKSLIDDRNRTFEFLISRFTKVWRPFQLNEKLLQNYRTIDQPPVFRSACIIWKRRKLQMQQISAGKSLTRKCTLRSKESHPINGLSTLPCIKCHNAKCFVHLLELGIHSCEAVFMHDQDSSNGASWHEFHMKQRESFRQRRAEAEEAEKTGSAINTLATSGWAAKKYKLCIPVNADKTRGGWYDSDIGTVNTFSSGVDPTEEDEIALISTKKVNDLTSDGGRTPRLTIRLPARPTNNVYPAKPINLAYVLVPPAPYDTSSLGKRLRIEEPADILGSKPSIIASRSYESYSTSPRIGLPKFKKIKSSSQISTTNFRTDFKINRLDVEETPITDFRTPKRSTGQAVLVPHHESVLVGRTSSALSSPQLEVRQAPQVRQDNKAQRTSLNTTNFADSFSSEGSFRKFVHNISEEINALRNYLMRQPIHLVDQSFLTQKLDEYKHMSSYLQGSVLKLEREVNSLKETNLKMRKDPAKAPVLAETGPDAIGSRAYQTATRNMRHSNIRHHGDHIGRYRNNDAGRLNHDDSRRESYHNISKRRCGPPKHYDRNNHIDSGKLDYPQQGRDRGRSHSGSYDRDGGADNQEVNRHSNMTVKSKTAAIEGCDQTPGRSEGYIPHHQSPSLEERRSPS